MEKKEFLSKIYKFSLQFEELYKVPSMFIMAQTTLETGWGKFMPQYNVGGIKAKKDKQGMPIGAFQKLWTWEFLKSEAEAMKFVGYSAKDSSWQKGKYKARVQDYFASYKTFEEGVNEYMKILLLPRYKSAFTKSTLIDFAIEVKKFGYSTDPDYIIKIVKISEAIKRELNLN